MKNIKKSSLILSAAIAAIMSGSVFAGETFVNNLTPYYTPNYDKGKITTDHAMKPVLCVQTNDNPPPYSSTNPAPPEELWPANNDPLSVSPAPKYTHDDHPKTEWFQANIRLGGCDANTNTYLGNIWAGKGSGATVTVTPQAPEGIIHLDSTEATLAGIKGRLAIRAPFRNDDLRQNENISTDWLTGINLSGLEFSTYLNSSTIPNISEKGSPGVGPGPDAKNLTSFLTEGANTVRIPIRWAYMEPYGPNTYKQTDPTTSAAFNDYMNLVIPELQSLTSKGYNVILDLHSYMHYATIGKDVAGCSDRQTGQGEQQLCPQGDADITPQDYVAIWTAIQQKIAQQGKSIDQTHLLYDIVNEPSSENSGHDKDQITPKNVFDMETSVISALNKLDFKGKYLIEGYKFSGLHSWKAADNSAQFTRTNFNNAGISNEIIDKQIIINAHQYLDSDFSGTHDSCLDKEGKPQNIYNNTDFHLQDFLSYLSTNNFKAMVTEFGVGSDKNTCQPVLNQFLGWMKKYAYTSTTGYGFVGWTAWSTGHGWGGPKQGTQGYNMLIQPANSGEEYSWKGAALANCYDKANKDCGTVGPTPPGPTPTPPTDPSIISIINGTSSSVTEKYNYGGGKFYCTTDDGSAGTPCHENLDQNHFQAIKLTAGGYIDFDFGLTHITLDNYVTGGNVQMHFDGTGCLLANGKSYTASSTTKKDLTIDPKSGVKLVPCASK